ncbi:hypothetical protein C8F04DRAFT_1267207 [Mycena alexandri]|uniref:Uncharacterized protein n=1 Tax=Mycena alexandri TaxID=1745969 RepID=A0AAD6SJK8_9AGAR|nr:hypothetical protein C8F04DRAFT_1267207 [Mycena alexandri]
MSFYSRHRALQPQSGTARAARSWAKFPFTAATSLPYLHPLHLHPPDATSLSTSCTGSTSSNTGSEQSVYANATACSSGERMQSAQSVLSTPPHPYRMRAYDPSAYAGGAHIERANGGVRRCAPRLVLRGSLGVRVRVDGGG